MKKILQFFLISLMLLLCAGLFVRTLIGARLELFRSMYVERPVTAVGEITGFETRTTVTDGIKTNSLFPVVTFYTEDGEKRKFVSEITARPEMQNGDKIEVLFNAKKAVIRQEYVSARNALLICLVLSVLAVAAIAAATLHAFFGKPKQKKKRRNPYKKYLWRL